MSKTPTEQSPDTRGCRYRPLLTLLSIAGVITALDLFGAFAYWSYGVVAVLALTVATTVVFRSRARIVLAPFALLCVWLLVLPEIRWSLEKAFYSDCGKIVEGMGVADVRALMAKYYLQTVSPGDPQSEDLLLRPHLTFHPSLGRSADWCVVSVEDGRVTGAEALPD